MVRQLALPLLYVMCVALAFCSYQSALEVQWGYWMQSRLCIANSRAHAGSVATKPALPLLNRRSWRKPACTLRPLQAGKLPARFPSLQLDGREPFALTSFALSLLLVCASQQGVHLGPHVGRWPARCCQSHCVTWD